MRFPATRLLLITCAIVLAGSGAWVTSASAQEIANNAPVVHSGNTNIVFESAGMSGLPSARYQAFDQFASEHPDVGNALARNPRLITNDNFTQQHPALADFLRANPEVASDFAANPGNYVDMPLAVAASIKKHPIE